MILRLRFCRRSLLGSAALLVLAPFVVAAAVLSSVKADASPDAAPENASTPAVRTNAATLQPPTPQADFWVAPDGKDSNPGTAAAPFATLARARDAVRAKVAAKLSKDVRVLIHGGTYSQTDTLLFEPQDSGTEKHSITYSACPGEKVVLSGGRRITGWKKGAGEIWTTEISEVKAGKWHFRQLFVNGKRALRARTPNVSDKTPWWIIKTSTAERPFIVSVNGPIQAYGNPDDVELVCIYNNEGSRERLQSVDATQQVFTLAPPKPNPKCFGADWSLGTPQPGKACYLENALEMLDQAGEWYLDSRSGILSYWPRPGEDLTGDEVIAPVAQNTILAVVGRRGQAVMNVHFKGLHVEYVDWPLPEWGYTGLFSCNVAIGSKEKPGHRFIEAAVEFEHARGCDFVDGGIAHVGANGLCLRDGTAHNVIEGNEICDLGGNGIGAGGCNVAAGYLHAAPPPEEGEYKGYRIANNHIHDCGTDYFGGSGICLYLSQDAVVAHNLVHDTAYFGIGLAGSQDPKVPFAKDNTIEYNHVYRAMKVTVDGSGLYVTFAHYGRGTLVRGNLIHDTQWNRFGRGEILNGIHDTIPCHGLYLDGNNSGCRYEGNVVFRNAGGPLLFNAPKKNNQWVDNLFQKDGTPPPEFLEAMESLAGLEPTYRQSILKSQDDPCNFCELTGEHSQTGGWAAYQFDRPKSGWGVVEVFHRPDSKHGSLPVTLRGLDPSAKYVLKAYVGRLAQADERFYSGTFFGNCDKSLFTRYLAALGDLPILCDVAAVPATDVVSVPGSGQSTVTGRELIEKGLLSKVRKSTGVMWIVYQRAE